MRARLKGEAGFSLVPAVATMALLVVLGGVAVSEAVSALRHSAEQTNVKRALQAADAAIDSAVFRLNRADLTGGINIDPLNPSSVTSQNCVVSVNDSTGFDVAGLSATAAVDSNGKRWCPQTAVEDGGDGATWSYRVSELARVGAEGCTGTGVLTLDREIVAVASAGPITRRVHARLRANVALLSGAAVQSGSSTSALTMSGTARVAGNVQANHDITAAATNVITGSAIPGPGHAVSGGVVPVGTTTAACSKFVLPKVDAGTTATTNDNTLFTADCVTALLVSTPCTALSGFPPTLTTSGGATYTAATKTLRVWGNGRAVLTGSTYSLCNLKLEGQGMLVIKSTTPVTRIFLRDPADCAGVPGAGTVAMDGSARIVNCHAQTQPQTLQLYALGSSSTATTQTLAGSGLLSSTLMAAVCGANIPLLGVPMVVYAPNSRVELGGTVALAGQVAGDTVAMSGSASVTPVNALVNLNQFGGNPILPLYKPTDYVECTGRAFSALPDANPAEGC
ncbi:MAG: hypothetical protein QOF53_1019 [Nocardioidaceae bacterium]|nr:hypothetical protein [Nocardioidaceae bacterium]